MIRFTKMVATGNDFIMIDNRKNVIRNRAGFARKYCQRHFSIGADGAIFIEKQKGKQMSKDRADFCMRIFNPDGSEAEMCGNGARCAAVFAYRRGIVRDRRLCFQTLAGLIRASVSGFRAMIGMESPSELELQKYILVKGKKIKVSYINTGVPHTVLLYRNIDNLDIQQLSPPIRYNRAFPEGTNVDFIQVINSHRIKMRTYERGVEGETLACGTGAIASAIVSTLLGYTQPPVEVLALGGMLRVHFKNTGNIVEEVRRAIINTRQREQIFIAQKIRDIYLEGEARVVYEGEIADERP